MARIEHTICWDCKKACCGCSWSAEFKPVKGWVATPAKIKSIQGQYQGSFIVHECPQFERDATGFGMKWTKKPNTIIRRNYKKNETGIYVESGF